MQVQDLIPDMFRLAVDHLGSGVIITDPKQDDNPIVYVNEGFTTITGFPTADVLGKNCRFLQGPDTDRNVVGQLREAVQESRPFRSLLLNYRMDGTPFWNGLVINPIFDGENELAYFIGTINDVTASREQLRALAARMTAVREEERTHIAREIHDELGQSLTGLKMDVSLMDKRLTEFGTGPQVAQLRNKITTMLQLIDSTIGTVRKIATELRPAVLDDLGLEAAIEWQAQNFQSRMGIRCMLRSDLGDVELSPEQATGLFRIMQEALTNVARHAQATRVDIHLTRTEDDVILEVSDNGRGITERQLANVKSLGLLGMRERALLLEGETTIRSNTRSSGTTVTVRIPLVPRQKAAWFEMS